MIPYSFINPVDPRELSDSESSRRGDQFARPELFSRIFHCPEHEVARSITIAVGNELPTLLVAKGNLSIHVLI
jgi:hypothetical protein